MSLANNAAVFEIMSFILWRHILSLNLGGDCGNLTILLLVNTTEAAN